MSTKDFWEGYVPEPDKRQQALDKMAENARELGLDYEPAQQEPVRAWFTVDELNAWADQKLKDNPHWGNRPAQQEPVAMVCHDLDGHIGWNPNLRQLPDEGTALYTSPPAQRTWVGLTDEDVRQCSRDVVAGGKENSVDRFAYAIEAKLKEKNT